MIDVDIFHPMRKGFFVGLYQYQSVIQDAEFWHALETTLWFTLQAVFIEFWLGLGLAFVKRICEEHGVELMLADAETLAGARV